MYSASHLLYNYNGGGGGVFDCYLTSLSSVPRRPLKNFLCPLGPVGVGVWGGGGLGRLNF